MAKYRKFYYSAGYVGTDTTEIMQFEDTATDEEIEEEFAIWVDEQHSWESEHTEITKEEAQEIGIDCKY